MSTRWVHPSRPLRLTRDLSIPSHQLCEARDNLRPGTREHFLEGLSRDWPEEVDRYQRLFDGRAYLANGAISQVDTVMTELRSEWVWAPRRRQSRPAVAPPTQLQRPLAG